MQRRSTDSNSPDVRIKLDRDELRTLARVARYYERSMGVFRIAVKMTASGQIRAKYRYLREESAWLERFAEAEIRRAETTEESVTEVKITILALVAFWGRLLSSLESPRSRRKLTREEATRRRHMADVFRDKISTLYKHAPSVVEECIGTRREREARWMWSYLNPRPVPSADDSVSDDQMHTRF